MPKPAPRSAALIVNTRSRKGEALFRRARALLEAKDIDLRLCTAVKDPAEIPHAVRDAVRAEIDLVIVGGGDGTISCAVDPLVGSKSVFALLPLGTANSFARTLGISIDVEAAVDVATGGKVQAIDLPRIGNDYFANCAAIGLAPMIAESIPHGLKRWLGRPGYLAWAALQLARFEPFTLTVKAGRKRRTLRALEVRIANGAYQGGTELIDTHPSSGEIVIQVVTGGTRAGLLWSWGLSLAGADRARETVEEFRGTAFAIATDPPLPVSIDGEILAKTPIEIRLEQRAIRMMVPC
jgi:YegS/Rv2252/BmrU family lipid kinase